METCPICSEAFKQNDPQSVFNHYKDKHPTQFNDCIQVANRMLNESYNEYCKKRDAILGIKITQKPA